MNNATNTKAFIFIGRSGAGKGTQAKLVVERLKAEESANDVLYIQSGGEFREFIKGPSETAQRARKVNDVGGLQPEFLAVYMWIGVLVKNYQTGDNLVFDGTPRKLHEAGVLHSIFDFYGIEKPTVVYINVSAKWATDHLVLRGRQDDTKNEIAKRLSWFDTDVLPCIEYYKNSPSYNFIEINGEQSVEDVNKDVMKAIFG